MKKQILLLMLGIFSLSGAVAQTKIIAHRGFWDTENSAQNSITSLYKAAEAGCYGAEFDVQTTSDGVLIVYHDNDIEGMYIPDTPYEKLRNFKLKNGEILPTLDQYLIHAKNCPDIKLILEIKAGKLPEEKVKSFVNSVLEHVDRHQLQGRTEYIAFNMDICKELRRRRPDVDIAYLNGDASPSQLKELGLTGPDYHHSKFTDNPDLVNQAHQQGLIVNVWTVNDSALMKKLIGMGVDYITTDKPLLVKKIINE